MTIKPTDATHVLLWSRNQSALHIEPIAVMLTNNRRAYADNRGTDYVPVFFGSNDECHEASAAMTRTMAARYASRPTSQPQ